jgi:hypothetical protein
MFRTRSLPASPRQDRGAYHVQTTSETVFICRYMCVGRSFNAEGVWFASHRGRVIRGGLALQRHELGGGNRRQVVALAAISPAPKAIARGVLRSRRSRQRPPRRRRSLNSSDAHDRRGAGRAGITARRRSAGATDATTAVIESSARCFSTATTPENRPRSAAGRGASWSAGWSTTRARLSRWSGRIRATSCSRRSRRGGSAVDSAVDRPESPRERRRPSPYVEGQE